MNQVGGARSVSLPFKGEGTETGGKKKIHESELIITKYKNTSSLRPTTEYDRVLQYSMKYTLCTIYISVTF